MFGGFFEVFFFLRGCWFSFVVFVCCLCGFFVLFVCGIFVGRVGIVFTPSLLLYFHIY